LPIVFTVDHNRREVHSIAIGPITYESIRSHLMQERHWGGLAYPELVDARGAGINITSSEVRQIVELLRTMGHQARMGPTAILVSSDLAFGLVRMVEMLVDDCCEVKPFRDEAEARAWLASKSQATS
jgi:hypothetical protein